MGIPRASLSIHALPLIAAQHYPSSSGASTTTFGVMKSSEPGSFYQLNDKLAATWANVAPTGQAPETEFHGSCAPVPLMEHQCLLTPEPRQLLHI